MVKAPRVAITTRQNHACEAFILDVAGQGRQFAKIDHERIQPRHLQDFNESVTNSQHNASATCRNGGERLGEGNEPHTNRIAIVGPTVNELRRETHGSDRRPIKNVFESQLSPCAVVVLVVV